MIAIFHDKVMDAVSVPATIKSASFDNTLLVIFFRIYASLILHANAISSSSVNLNPPSSRAFITLGPLA